MHSSVDRNTKDKVNFEHGDITTYETLDYDIIYSYDVLMNKTITDKVDEILAKSRFQYFISFCEHDSYPSLTPVGKISALHTTGSQRFTAYVYKKKEDDVPPPLEQGEAMDLDADDDFLQPPSLPKVLPPKTPTTPKRKRRNPSPVPEPPTPAPSVPVPVPVPAPAVPVPNKLADMMNKFRDFVKSPLYERTQGAVRNPLDAEQEERRQGWRVDYADVGEETGGVQRSKLFQADFTLEDAGVAIMDAQHFYADAAVRIVNEHQQDIGKGEGDVMADVWRRHYFQKEVKVQEVVAGGTPFVFYLKTGKTVHTEPELIIVDRQQSRITHCHLGDTDLSRIDVILAEYPNFRYRQVSLKMETKQTDQPFFPTTYNHLVLTYAAIAYMAGVPLATLPALSAADATTLMRAFSRGYKFQSFG